MAKKDTKRVSINAWEKVMKEDFDTKPVVVEWHGIDIEIKKTIPLTDMLQLVEDVVNACFTNDGGFIPQAEQFALKSMVLAYYAGFAMPSSLEKQYDLVTNTDAFDFVVEHIDSLQFADIMDAVERKIDYLCDSNAVAIKAQTDKVLIEFQKLGESMEAVFSGMSADDVQKIISAVGNMGDVSEEKIVNAYMKQKQSDGVDAEDTGHTATEEDDPGADSSGD